MLAGTAFRLRSVPALKLKGRLRAALRRSQALLEKGALDRVGGELERPHVGLGRLLGAPGPGQKLGPGGVQVQVALEPVYPLERLEPLIANLRGLPRRRSPRAP